MGDEEKQAEQAPTETEGGSPSEGTEEQPADAPADPPAEGGDGGDDSGE